MPVRFAVNERDALRKARRGLEGRRLYFSDEPMNQRLLPYAIHRKDDFGGEECDSRTKQRIYVIITPHLY